MGKIKPTLVFGDTHLPFAVDGWLDFLKNVHREYDCADTVICTGDLIDLHQYSFHTSETDAMSGIDEYDLANYHVGKLSEAFPNLIWTLGNHDMIIIRRMKEIGIDERFVRTMHELFELPKTWQIVDEIVIDDVLYRHQGQCGGKMGHLNSAVANMMSTVVGHLHSNGGVAYMTNPSFKTVFGLNTGGLVDDSSYASRYGRNAKAKTVLGCGIVHNSSRADFVPFQ